MTTCLLNFLQTMENVIFNMLLNINAGKSSQKIYKKIMPCTKHKAFIQNINALSSFFKYQSKNFFTLKILCNF